jgi:D-alanyl-D-alanine carboxypeptidase/D-alanyl-D-alanine-endopeptidase (penicillin-binding protein 4)
MNWMKRASSILGIFYLVNFGDIAQAELNRSKLSNRLASTKLAEHGVIFTRLSDGKVLYEQSADSLLSPASVTKVITSAAALSYFGPAFTFKTPIYYTGKVDNHILQGDLYIKGNGDPFIISEILWQTAVDLRHLGIKEIRGSIIIDNQLFDGEVRDESRLNGTQKSTHAYDAPVSSFAVNFNTVAVATAPSSLGHLALTGTTPFALKHVKLTSKTRTVKGNQSAGVSLSRNTTADGGISLASSGVIGVDATIKKIYRSVGDPSVAAGDYFVSFLNDAGIRTSGRTRTGKTPNNAALLYEINGLEMRRIAQGLNTFSNNFIADMLTKRLGAAFGNSTIPDLPESGTLASGMKILANFLKSDVGIPGEFKLLNGSGLSTENRLSARQISLVLSWMESRGELFPDFIASLPANGWDGTLKKRMKKSDDLVGQIHAKSGTLTEPITVAALAGYFRHPREGWTSFVMISNGKEGQSQPGLQDLRNLQDDVLKGFFLN